jgi:DNA-binding PucR family transcriptional regulator
MNLVRDLLDGQTADSEPLGYDVDSEHTAVVIQGPRAEPVADELAARATGAVLSLSVDPVTNWLWTAGGLDLHGYVPPAGTRVAVGGPAVGPDGFRRAHFDARAAARVAHHRPQRMLRYGDVALEALAGQDEARARDFIEHELGPLLSAPSGDTLVATLEAYYAAGQNAVSAAAALGVHDRTIANRLRKVEEALGDGAIVSRRAEVETALRLRRLLATEPSG